jgi:ankyrin repeat protein
MELLQDNRTDVDHPNPHGRTPFSLAAGDKRVAIMQLLIRHRADPHWEDNDHHTGFWWFLKARFDSDFRMPIILGQQTQYSWEAARCEIGELIDSLPRPDDQDSTGRSWLSWAAEYGDEHVVQQLLANKDVDPNQCDKSAGTFARTPMIWAAEKHHESLVRLMIDQKKDDFSLHYVIRHSKVYERELGEERMLNTVKTLVSQGEAGDSWITERCDPEGTKPLHLACYQGNDKIVDILIEDRVGLNSKDRTGRTPLQYALQQKHEEIARRLLKLMSKIQSVQSSDWFKVADQETYWVKVFQKATTSDFDWDLIRKPECDGLLCKEQRTL